jgi:hypothetical protein
VSPYREFANGLLIAIYNRHAQDDPQFIRLGDVAAQFNGTMQPSWLRRFADESEERTYLQVERSIGQAEGWMVRMRPFGFEYVEDSLEHASVPSVSSQTLLTDEFSAELLPASDRLVPLNHNSAEYQQVRAAIFSLREELRSANDLPIDAQERQRIIRSLSAAEQLWEAAQLKIVQIRVGIIIAVEDAIKVLSTVGKAVAQGLTIDAIKALVKAATGISI